ncbi:MAG: hypothetical protein ABSD13_03760 [Candidatus Korobacteraceae bacterium]|jgi:hypothetical protein
MASSNDPRLYRRVYGNGVSAPQTPGSLGRNDAADPNAISHSGNSQGPLGSNGDHAAQTASAAQHGGGLSKAAVSILLLDKLKLALFLRSVAHDLATSQLIKKRTEGVFFKDTDVDTGTLAEQKDMADKNLDRLHVQFAKAVAQGSKAAVQFLLDQDEERSKARDHIKQVFAEASRSNEQNTRNLGTTVKVLKSVEIVSGAVLTVSALFVSAPAELTAGVIGFGYDTVTDVIDKVGEAQKKDAALVALVAGQTGIKSGLGAAQQKLQGKLAGAELKEVEKLEKSVEHLAGKIEVKQQMIEATKSIRNKNKLTRLMAKDESALAKATKTVHRFRGVAIVFAAFDLAGRVTDLQKVWHED